MRFYLSSYKIGKETAAFKRLFPKNRKTAYIPNALDFSSDLARRKKSIQSDILPLTELGLKVEILDLRDYFSKPKKLEKKCSEFGVFWVRGGNAFVLRQAMHKSGFDVLVKKMHREKADVVYSGFSAGICVLGPSLKGIHIMDDLSQKPYGKPSKIIWKGLGLLDYTIVPHYKSPHPETELADKAISYLIEKKILFKALRDGEALIVV